MSLDDADRLDRPRFRIREGDDQHVQSRPMNRGPPAKGDRAGQSSILDAATSRSRSGGPSFSLSNRARRLAWTIVWGCCAAWTPRQLHPWRRLLLRLFGATMGERSDVRGSARVWYPPYLVMADRALIAARVTCYNMATVRIGEDVIVSQGAHLCAGSHDIDSADFQLVARPITIRAQAWIAAEAFVGPGVTIGEGAVLGARAAAFRDLEPWTVYSGNPAQPLRKRVVAQR